jgi:hypothetical protein
MFRTIDFLVFFIYVYVDDDDNEEKEKRVGDIGHAFTK